ncbi:transcriptional regulator, TetR family [Streptoalloteichus tenebrarius]|uniref:Transcriptional regulator, TetR family n=1 Tax=Streptoalloteichus tenebrarius (strain ATCC 17920 / DSM 40477 / JCM 4838 / CBS 697.72 / NBRC 16177 / NCIMB 11028 / NRRL B-12390 / A12253. 1 / ISP 5477) TaxID=1933 RepID=A0ABT1HLZ3_STRSD|nr:transcriptional regulator, TetR family [Streptoalloteichus tenebrarius]
MEAAIATIAELGYARTSFAKITKRAGLSGTGMISYHFAGKDDLVRACAEETSRVLAAFLRPRIEAVSGYAAKPRAFVESTIELVEAHPAHLRALVEILNNAKDPEGRLLVDAALLTSRVTHVATHLRDGQRVGEFGASPCRSQAVIIDGSPECAPPWREPVETVSTRPSRRASSAGVTGAGRGSGGMAQVRVQLREAMETSLITLSGKAVDARRSPSILGDTMSSEILDRIDYDEARLAMSARFAPSVAARAKHFDDWTREFLRGHERATVVHLGAGLDTRPWRVDPGPGVTWLDVDYPEVVDVRGKLFPPREDYRMIGCPVTSPEWLDQVPADRPTLVLAEGLTMYLRPAEGHELFRRITDRFPWGVLAFDVHNRLAIRLVNRRLTRIVGSPLLRWGVDDARELECANPKLRRVDAVSALFAPSAAGLPLGARIFARLVRPVRSLRDLGMYLRYEFGDPSQV